MWLLVTIQEENSKRTSLALSGFTHLCFLPSSTSCLPASPLVLVTLLCIALNTPCHLQPLGPPPSGALSSMPLPSEDLPFSFEAQAWHPFSHLGAIQIYEAASTGQDTQHGPSQYLWNGKQLSWEQKHKSGLWRNPQEERGYENFMHTSSEVLLASEHLSHIKYYVIYTVSDKKANSQ